MFLFNGLVKELKFKEKKVQGEIFSFKLKDILNEVIIGVGNFVFFDLIIKKKFSNSKIQFNNGRINMKLYLIFFIFFFYILVYINFGEIYVSIYYIIYL